MGAFHAYDIRGIYNVDFDKDTAYKVGYFLPELLGTDRVLVGRDCRVSSPEIHDCLIKGITDAGADVDDIGLSSTPLVYFGTANYGYKASVQITASHNPAEYNGIKFLGSDGCKLSDDEELAIENLLSDEANNSASKKIGRVHFRADLVKHYASHIAGCLEDGAAVNNVVFDCAAGASAMSVPVLVENSKFSELNTNIISKDFYYPTKQIILQPLTKYVQAVKKVIGYGIYFLS